MTASTPAPPVPVAGNPLLSPVPKGTSFSTPLPAALCPSTSLFARSSLSSRRRWVLGEWSQHFSGLDSPQGHPWVTPLPCTALGGFEMLGVWAFTLAWSLGSSQPLLPKSRSGCPPHSQLLRKELGAVWPGCLLVPALVTEDMSICPLNLLQWLC